MNKERTMQTGGVGKRIAKEYKTELSMLAIFVVFPDNKEYHERYESGFFHCTDGHRYDAGHYYLRH